MTSRDTGHPEQYATAGSLIKRIDILEQEKKALWNMLFSIPKPVLAKYGIHLYDIPSTIEEKQDNDQI
jgi:hypothetical protein